MVSEMLSAANPPHGVVQMQRTYFACLCVMGLQTLSFNCMAVTAFCHLLATLKQRTTLSYKPAKLPSVIIDVSVGLEGSYVYLHAVAPQISWPWWHRSVTAGRIWWLKNEDHHCRFLFAGGRVCVFSLHSSVNLRKKRITASEHCNTCLHDRTILTCYYTTDEE